MGSASSAPPPPDTTRFSQGMENMSRQMQDWSAELYQTGMDAWQQLSDNSQSLLGAALPAMADSFSWAAEQRDRFNEHIMPQMESLFKEAETYASKGEEQRQRSSAIQDTKSAAEAQRNAQLRKLESYGVDPTDTRYAALDQQAGVGEAAMSALAANQASERTKQIGRDLRTEAIGVGGQFLQDANASNQIGAGIGTGAINAASTATNAGVNASGAALPYMAGATSALGQGAGIVDTSYGRDLNYAEDQRAAEAADAGGMAGLANIAGAGLSMTPWGEAAGAVLNAAAEGGPVSAPGGPTSDSGALAISDGEYVVPADVVKKLGTNHFDKMIEKETGRQPPGQKQALPIPQVQGVF